MDTESQQQHPVEDSASLARRRLLKLAVYAPPAILGAMIAGPTIATAKTVNCANGKITVSAYGTACCPCVPGDPAYNAVTCLQEKCKVGNCTACRAVYGLGPYTSKAICNDVSQACGCACSTGKAPYTCL